MTISGIIICSTCGHKIRLRHQVGYVYPAVVKIACNQCGKIIKGHVRRADPAFDFPNETVSMEYEETTQTLSVSTELPVALKVSNIQGMAALTPFMGIGTILGFENIKKHELNIREFIKIYDPQYHRLQTSFELFESKNWEYYLVEIKKHFRKEISLDIKTFEECSTVLKEVNKDFFKFIENDYYQIHFNKKLQGETIDKVLSKIPELKNLRTTVETYINIENEFVKGVKLIDNFLSNVKSFFPVAALSYSNNYTKEYLDEVGLTTFEFLDLKEMYIEQFEYLSRISSLYFGLINLAERNNFDDFGAIPDASQLTVYFGKDNGIKKDIIKKNALLDAYFIDTLNSQIRNGLGHLKTIYDPKIQLIKYYPYKDAARMNSHKEIFLIDFAVQVYEQALKVRDSLEILCKFVNLTK
jgi:hypothetical protein